MTDRPLMLPEESADLEDDAWVAVCRLAEQIEEGTGADAEGVALAMPRWSGLTRR